MRRVLASDPGHSLYSKRKYSIEPVVGRIKANRRIDRFQQSGRAAVRREWRLIAASQAAQASQPLDPARQRIVTQRRIADQARHPSPTTNCQAFLRQPVGEK